MEKPLGERHTILSERGAKNGTDVEEFANADCHAEPCAVLRAEPHADKFAEDKLRAEPRAVFRADGCAEKMAQMRKRRSNFFYVLR